PTLTHSPPPSLQRAGAAAITATHIPIVIATLDGAHRQVSPGVGHRQQGWSVVVGLLDIRCTGGAH
ncbi:MAG: hypothetical protein GY722_16365, partial [bacterium]|nr:hypothetical protein [bacterium]